MNISIVGTEVKIKEILPQYFRE